MNTVNIKLYILMRLRLLGLTEGLTDSEFYSRAEELLFLYEKAVVK